MQLGFWWSVGIVLGVAVSTFVVGVFLAPFLEMPAWLAIGGWAVLLFVSYGTLVRWVFSAQREE